jgi:2-polyprenyl-3-methyl-5-hydroxy-6-metoxy-1,4-benzoquinol methylase
MDNIEKRLGEYAERGNYHESLDSDWKYLPVYVAKRERIDRFFRSLPKETRVLDLGCGEGTLVKKYRGQGYNIMGMDLHYESEFVKRGSILETRLPDSSYDLLLCLDVIEHLSFEDQELAIAEMARLLPPGGRLLLTVPNLAHLASRFLFLLRGQLIRTSTLDRHPGDRPLHEYRDLLKRHFNIVSCEGIFPTLPLIVLLSWWKPEASIPLHRIYNRLLAVPGWCFLSVFICEKK